MILAAQFESYSEPFAIMLSLPLAVIGALIGLFLGGSELSLISAIGIMMLMGLCHQECYSFNRLCQTTYAGRCSLQ